MKIVLYRAVARTGHKTIEKLKEIDESRGIYASDKDIATWRKAYEIINGVEIIVGQTHFDTDRQFTLLGWPSESSAKMKEFIYLAEQDEAFGMYHDARKEFDEDWESGKYEPEGSLCFFREDLEFIEQL